MKVGDLVKNLCWRPDGSSLGIIVSIRNSPTGICKVLLPDGSLIDQLPENLEVISESR